MRPNRTPGIRRSEGVRLGLACERARVLNGIEWRTVCTQRERERGREREREREGEPRLDVSKLEELAELDKKLAAEGMPEATPLDINTSSNTNNTLVNNNSNKCTYEITST